MTKPTDLHPVAVQKHPTSRAKKRGRNLLHEGSTVKIGGRTFYIKRLEGQKVVLRDNRGRVTERSLVDLMLNTSAKLPETTEIDLSRSARELDLVTPEQRAEIDYWVGHINEVLTGDRQGRLDVTPRPGYERHLPLRQRQATKAAELRCSVKKISRRCLSQISDGPMAHLDARTTRPTQRFKTVDYRVRDALAAEIALAVETGTTTYKRTMIRKAQLSLRQNYPRETINLPSYSLLCELIEVLQAGNPVTRGSAKTRSSVTSRPSTRFNSREVVRAGQIVQMDTTVLDVFCIDRVSGRTYRPELTVMIDRRTRLIIGMCLVEHTTANDVSGLIARSMRPMPTDPSLDANGQWPYLGLPETIEYGHLGAPQNAHGLPLIAPETIVVDNGAPFIALDVRVLCSKLGISIEPTRPYTGTDKPQNERFWGTLSRGPLPLCAGFVGGSVASKGRLAESQAYFFTDEMYEFIKEWTAKIYHHTPHLGTNVPEAGVSALSPIEMYNVSVAEAGLVVPQTNPDFWMRLMPHIARKITSAPISLRGLHYDSPVLLAYSNQLSAEKDGKWTFHYDPQDLRQIYFLDPAGTWHEIPWVHRYRVDVPFGGDALDFVRKLNRKRTVPAKAIDSALLDLMQRWRMGQADTTAERAAATRMDHYLRKLAAEERPLSAPASTIASDHQRKKKASVPNASTDVAALPVVEVRGPKDPEFYDLPDDDDNDFIVDLPDAEFTLA